MRAVSWMVWSRSSSSGGAGAGEYAQAAQRHLDVAGAQFDVAVEILELAPVPHLDGAEIAVFVLADAHAFGIVAVGAERRGAGRADPLAAALVAALLFGEALAQRLQDLVEPAHGFDLLLLLLGEVFFGEFFEPFRRNVGALRVGEKVEPFEDLAEDAVELVEIALVLHQRGAREIIKVLHPPAGEVLVHGLQQDQVFAQRHRQTGGAQFTEEGGQHRP